MYHPNRVLLRRIQSYLEQFVGYNRFNAHQSDIVSQTNTRSIYFGSHRNPLPNDVSDYLSASDLPPEAKVIIYGNELVSKALAFHLSDTTIGSNVIVIRGEGPMKSNLQIDPSSALNSFYVNHLVVANPRSSLLIRHSCELYSMNTCGAIYLAQTEERVKSFKRMISISKLFIPKELGSIEILSPEGIKIFNFCFTNYGVLFRNQASIWFHWCQ